MADFLDYLYEDWTDHKDKHAGSASEYAEKIKGLCKELASMSEQYDMYTLKDIARRLEDMFEDLDRQVDNKKKDKAIRDKYAAQSALGHSVRAESVIEEGFLSSLLKPAKPAKKSKASAVKKKSTEGDGLAELRAKFHAPERRWKVKSYWDRQARNTPEALAKFHSDYHAQMKKTDADIAAFHAGPLGAKKKNKAGVSEEPNNKPKGKK